MKEKTPDQLYFDEIMSDIYELLKPLGGEKKELYIVPNATHCDLYDNKAGKIPYDKLESFFKENL